LRFARQIPGIRSATIFGQSIHALIEDISICTTSRTVVEGRHSVAEIRPLAPSLEDVFVELTYKHPNAAGGLRA